MVLLGRVDRIWMLGTREMSIFLEANSTRRIKAITSSPPNYADAVHAYWTCWSTATPVSWHRPATLG
jgi:hypothetical protein